MISLGISIWNVATRRVATLFAMAGDDDGLLLADDGTPLEIYDDV